MGSAADRRSLLGCTIATNADASGYVKRSVLRDAYHDEFDSRPIKTKRTKADDTEQERDTQARRAWIEYKQSRIGKQASNRSRKSGSRGSNLSDHLSGDLQWLEREGVVVRLIEDDGVRVVDWAGLQRVIEYQPDAANVDV